MVVEIIKGALAGIVTAIIVILSAASIDEMLKKYKDKDN